MNQTTPRRRRRRSRRFPWWLAALLLCLVLCAALLQPFLPQRYYTAEELGITQLQSSDRRNADGIPFIIHHGNPIEDAVERDQMYRMKVYAHYRWLG